VQLVDGVEGGELRYRRHVLEDVHCPVTVIEA
jgi:hypothetical protein